MCRGSHVKRILLASAALIVALDQWTKVYIKNNFDLYEMRPVIDGFFSITHVLNPGAAFGMLAKLDESYRQIFFVCVTALAIAAVVYLMVKEKHLKLRLVSYTLILAGAVGNFIDRVYIGKVVDFLHFYYKSYAWPAFNVADISISVGICLLFLDYIVLNKREN